MSLKRGGKAKRPHAKSHPLHVIVSRPSVLVKLQSATWRTLCQWSLDRMQTLQSRSNQRESQMVYCGTHRGKKTLPFIHFRQALGKQSQMRLTLRKAIWQCLWNLSLFKGSVPSYSITVQITIHYTFSICLHSLAGFFLKLYPNSQIKSNSAFHNTLHNRQATLQKIMILIS